MTQARKDWLQNLDRYCYLLERSRLLTFILSQEAQASLAYRFGHRTLTSQPRNLLIRFIIVAHCIFLRLTSLFTGISLEPRAKISPGLYIGHFGGIIVGSGVKIGENCSLWTCVALGVDVRSEPPAFPQIVDRVLIGTGAKIFGAIVTGDDVAVGANGVVTKSAEARRVVGGIPARVLSHRGGFGVVTYHGCELDQARLASLALSTNSAQVRREDDAFR